VEIEFDPESLFNLDPATLQIFSSPDSKLWKPELTTIDWVNHIAKISVTHLTDFVLTGKTLDVTAPTSEVLINGEPLSEAAVFEDQAVVTFASQDDQDGVGVEKIWYQVNDSGWQDFAQEIEINLAGDYIVQFYAEDLAGNTEESHQVEFSIEGTSADPQSDPDQDTSNSEDDNQPGEETTDEEDTTGDQEENSPSETDEEAENSDDQEENSPSETGEEESSSPDEENSDAEDESPPSEQEENDNSSQPADESKETVTAQIQVDFKQNYFILNCTLVENCSHTVSSPNANSNLSTHKFSAQGVTLIEISLAEKANPNKLSPAIKSIKYGQSAKVLDTKTNYQAKENGEIKKFSFSAKLKTNNLTCSQ
jgi:hypothetical protein